LCHEFRQNPERVFFQNAPKGPRSAPKKDSVRERVIELRKQNYSVYDIQRALEESGQSLSPAAISQTLVEEGFARLPRRSDEERPPALRATPAAVFSDPLRRIVPFLAFSGSDPSGRSVEQVPLSRVANDSRQRCHTILVGDEVVRQRTA
jgi:hypothetical protein